jgi:predicted amidohydrolase YtcJ
MVAAARTTPRSASLRAWDPSSGQGDCVIGSHTAALIEPYADSGTRGGSLLDPAAMTRYVTLLDAIGFQVDVHAIGDRGIRESLDAFEAAQPANGRRDSRHQIAHGQLIVPQTFRASESSGHRKRPALLGENLRLRA